MDQQLFQSLKKILSLVAFFGTIFLILTLGGCGISTSDIVDQRKNQRELRFVEEELNDNLQVSCHGMQVNEDLDVRNGFISIVSMIIGEASSEERVFAKNATLRDIKDLESETITFLKAKEKLRGKILKADERIASQHDDWSWGWIIGIVISVAVGAFVAVKGLVLFGSAF